MLICINFIFAKIQINEINLKFCIKQVEGLIKYCYFFQKKCNKKELGCHLYRHLEKCILKNSSNSQSCLTCSLLSNINMNHGFNMILKLFMTLSEDGSFLTNEILPHTPKRRLLNLQQQGMSVVLMAN